MCSEMARFTKLVQPVRPQQEEPHRHRPIDLVYLARHTSGDSGLERDVLRIFDQVSRTYFSRIENSTNVDDLCHNLSSLKGAANGIGAWGIAELATAMETELSNGAPVDPERIEDLDWAVHEASEFIERMLALERS
jgi:hypothetical protein